MGPDDMLKPFYQEEWIEAGCDEAGRGSLAGPVFAAAVILPRDFFHPELDDSKKLTEKVRDRLREIIEREAVAWQVGISPAEEIDRINILNASFLSMTRAVERLSVRPGFLLVDGNRFRSSLDIPYRCVVGGDGKYASIAAASVIAKTHRDEYMKSLDREFPAYGWARNKGYGTLEHRRALAEFGFTAHHRLTFNSHYGQLSLF